MNWINLLERIWVAIQLTLYTVFGLAPIGLGIAMIYSSQTKEFEKDYQVSMNLGLGIVCLVIGLLVSWACLARAVHLYRNYRNS
ncbi:hypothetical protein C8D94_102365 [Marinirhabdus gelatinilytica]|uniref:Uncharacterized protein n=1 Tax=Marinirhabdus gelatinilytica TaxID=1703343 RepID=A0A370QFP3_9FLAO|nr:hypothetical protein C8D94_102365 [Marinirhabdus gelatinilytica]